MRSGGRPAPPCADRADGRRPFVWLASYLKSGNTWTRLLLANFLADSEQAVGMARFLGLEGATDGRRLRRAVAAADFARLQEQEARDGFRERYPLCRRFFRSGRSGDWRRHLSAAQARRIARRHGAVMRACGYDPREAEC